MTHSTFLTALSPEARVQGPRYPLGLLPVWSRLWRRVVRSITTLDAKHYDCDRWPDTASLTKRILYRFFLPDRYSSTGFPFERMGNAFLVPTVDTRHLQVLGLHDIDGETDDTPFGRVVVLGMSFEAVAELYYSESNGMLQNVAALVMEQMTSTVRASQGRARGGA